MQIHSLPTLTGLVTVYSLLSGVPLSAQIIPDNSLGSESSIVVPNQNINGINSDRIDGGAIRGSNLFHSFQEFNIDNGRGAYFSNPETISNILTRVTGSNISNIFGTLGVLGNANLFLINPNGIVFGPNARLDVGGSFFASTADSILFENGVEFAASNPDAPPLLTINIPIGLNFRENPGSIVSQTLSTQVDSEGNIPPATPLGLFVPPEKTIALIGGEVRLDNGLIASPGSRIELGGLSEPGIVQLNSDSSLSFPTNIQRADILLTDGAAAGVAGNPGGSIAINARNLEISDGSRVISGVFNDSNLLNIEDGENLDTESLQAGDITINATESVRLTGENSAIRNSVFSNATGNAGNIDIQTNSLSLRDGAQISASTFGNGNGGNLTVTATDVELFGRSAEGQFSSGLFASVASQATGNGGNLIVDTQNLRVQNGAQISASTSGNGDGGNLTIAAADIEIVGNGSRLLNQVNQEATGNGGTLTIDTQNLRVRDGAKISASTFSNGDGGNLTITATDIELINNGGLSASVETDATGNGGNLTVNTQNLRLQNDAQILASTFGNGDGGNLTIIANDIELIGTSGNSELLTGVAARVEPGATGNTGNLTIETQNLRVQNGATISASTLGNGDAGDLTITATDVELTGSRVATSVGLEAIGNAGNLTIETQNLQVQDGAEVSASTSGNGDGGNLTITATDIEIVGTSADGQFRSGLFAQVNQEATGNGGTLTIDTESLRVQDGAIISTATGGNGNGGDLIINTQNLLVQDAAAIFTATETIGNAGDLIIDTQNLLISSDGFIFTDTFSEGNAGQLIIRATEMVEVTGTSSSISNSVGAEATGNGATLSIETPNLQVRDGALILVSTQGNGDAGNLTINTQNLQVQDSALISVNVGSSGSGDGGNLTIDTQNLQVSNGSIVSADTFGEGNAGQLIIRATEGVEVTGISSFISSTVEPEATGNGGTLRIETPNLQVRDGARISVSTLGDGDAGNLTINTQNLQVQDDAQISASTFGNGNGGNLTITATDILLINGNLGASVQSEGVGNGGNLTINSQRLTLRDGAQIGTPTFGNGDAGNLTITATDVEVIGTSADGQVSSALGVSVQPEATGNGGNLNIDTQNLRVRDGAQISASTFGNGNGGNITVTATDIEVTGTSANGQASSALGVSVQPEATGNGGVLIIDTQNLLVLDGAQIEAATSGNGDGGDITITATDILLINGNLGTSVQPGAMGNAGNLNINTQNLRVLDGAQISAGTFGNGDGGNLTITANNIELVGTRTSIDGRFASSVFTSVEPEAIGNAGDLNIDTQNLQVRDGADILASTSGNGDAGDITINAMDIELIGIGSSLSASVEPEAIGNGGNLIINTQNLQVRDEALISVGTFGNGNAGELIITANDIELIGTSADGRFVSSIFASVEPGATGNGGSLIINTQNLRVLDGAQISTGTFGNGNAGNLTVTATDIELVGTAANGPAASGLFADVETESTGKGGELIVNADNLTIRDGARIDVRSEGIEAAGDLIINAPNIFLDNQATLNANTTAGEGDIILNTEDLRLRNNSNITTNATGEATGGNITINTETLTALQNSDISANAEDAFGGQVTINAGGVFGTAFRTQQSQFSDITATSELGPEFSGTVELNTELDPSSGLIDLTQTVTDPNDLIAAEFCRQRGSSAFIVTGRGGIAISPNDKSDGNQINVDLVEPVPFQPQNTSQNSSEINNNQPISSLDIIPARGWIRDENGDVILVSYDPTKTGVNRQQRQFPQCQP